MTGIPEKVYHVRGILAAGPHDATGDLALLVGLDGGDQAILRIEQTILSGLELVLKDYLSKQTYSDEGGMIAGRPMQLTSCQPFVDGQGSVGMVLQIEHMRLPIAFPIEGVSALISGLNRMVQLAKNPPNSMAH